MKKKIILLVLSIIIVFSVLSTTTYALFYNKDKLASEEYTTGNLSIVLDNDEQGLGNSLILSNALPVSDATGSSSTPYRFKLTNNGNLDYEFDLTLTRSGTINGSYVKVKVENKNAVTLTNTTTTVATGLTLKAGQSKIVNVRIWLIENTPNSEIGKTLTASLSAGGIAKYNKPLIRNNPNPPKLVQGLIPVMYNGSNWVKADSTNVNVTYKWYDYNSKIWANAVLVSSTNRSIYQNASEGTAIPESDVLAYYVWIPRYKYKVWNINKTIGYSSYNAINSGIDIVFENEVETTGTINCTYDFTVAEGNGLSETCTGNNNDYYTHPAFWWDMDGDSIRDNGEELEGFWIGKFELSSESPDLDTSFNGGSNKYDITVSKVRPSFLGNINEDVVRFISYDGGGQSNTLTVRIKPNVRIWKRNCIDNYWQVIYDMQTNNNIYGLLTDRDNTDSHMLKNIEWGAVAYLTNSNYGRCGNNMCSEVTSNSYGDVLNGIYTGGNDYVANVTQSTTGNIYGVYDMSGGAGEYVTGIVSCTAGIYDNCFHSYISQAKYLDGYAYGRLGSKQDDFNRTRLGDAVGELGIFYVVKYDAYYFMRGGTFSGDGNLFFASGNNDNYGYSTRAALIGL